MAEATKARRIRRTRGETGLRFFLAAVFLGLVEAAVFLLAGVFFVEVGLDVVLFGTVLFGGVLWAGALATGDGASPVSTDDLD